MLEKLSTLTIKRYRPSVLILLAIILFGAWSYTSLLDREGFPPIEVPFATVNGVYFVDDADEVDNQIIQPMTEEIEAIDEVLLVESIARNDSFSLFVEFSEDISSDEGAEKVQQQLESIAEVLPGTTQYEVAPISATLFNNEYNALISVYGSNGSSLYDLNQAAESLAVQLEDDARIDKAIVEDPFTESVNPETGRPEIRQTNFSGYGENTDGAIEATQAVVIGVVATGEVDDLEIDEAMQSTIDEWQADAGDIQAAISAGFAESIRTQINSLQSNVVTGLIAVIAVVGLLIGWRASVMIAFFIPTVLSATLIGVLASGNSLNTIVLFALVLVLGLIVDNAIVITEALDSAKRQRRQTTEKVIKDAVKRVGLALVAGTMTTVLVFMPILFVTGILGEFIRILPMTVIVALLSSLFIAFVFIPFFASGILLRSKKQAQPLLGGAMTRLSNYVLILPRKLSDMGKKGRRLMLGTVVTISALLVAGGMFMLGQLPLNIFPESNDADAIILRTGFDENTNIKQAERQVDKVNRVVSDTLGSDGQVVSYAQADARSAVIRITLRPFTERTTTSQTYIDRLDEQLTNNTDVEFTLQQLDAGPPPEPFPFAVQIRSEDVIASTNLAEDITQFLRTEEITRADGSVIQVDEVRLEADQSVVRRTAGHRFFQVSASYQASDISGLVTATQAAVEDAFPTEELESRGLQADTLTFDFGQESENIESFASVQIALVIAVILMYFLLVMQFNSFSQPLLILLTVPFGLIGVAAALLVADHSLSFFVMVGLIGLIGIVVNNAILLVDYANQARADGENIDKAIITALQQRFRPIVTTTLTTIGALTPLALADPFWEPLAITVIFGLIASTVLVVTVFPYFYILFEQARAFKNRKFPSLR